MLQRALGWPAIAAYGLGAILGAGIYSVIGAAAGLVGEAMWIAFAVSALVALITALSYAELAPMYPRAGAEFVYLQQALPRHRLLAFTVGAMMAASCAATSATVSIAFVTQLRGDVLVAGAVLIAAIVTAYAGARATRAR